MHNRFAMVAGVGFYGSRENPTTAKLGLSNTRVGIRKVATGNPEIKMVADVVLTLKSPPWIALSWVLFVFLGAFLTPTQHGTHCHNA